MPQFLKPKSLFNTKDTISRQCQMSFFSSSSAFSILLSQIYPCFEIHIHSLSFREILHESRTKTVKSHHQLDSEMLRSIKKLQLKQHECFLPNGEVRNIEPHQTLEPKRVKAEYRLGTLVSSSSFKPF